MINFEVPAGSFKFFSSGIIIYNNINSATSPDVNAFSNPTVYWANVPISVAASRSDMSESALYTSVAKSSFIISVVILERRFSSFSAATTCLNNTTILAV